MLDWVTLFNALALALIIEGLFMALGPKLMQGFFAQAAKADHKMLRSTGLGSIIAGVVFLYLIP
ncbi:MAG: DUF2065 domain-containing protein [Pseudomonadota bacterium]